jgi:hypothetical protein
MLKYLSLTLLNTRPHRDQELTEVAVAEVAETGTDHCTNI